MLLTSARFVSRLALVLVFAGAAVGESSAEVRTEVVVYKHGDVTLEGFLAWDAAAKEKRPGVLVCHEWWGNTEYSRGRARQLAELGYVAFALDMYGQGKTSMEAAKAQEWSGALRAKSGLMAERAAEGLKVLAARPEVDATRVAAIGYCMGGTVALELARTGADVKAIVCFHTSGLAAKSADEAKKIKGKVLVCHGAADTLVDPAVIADFKKQMDEAKAPYQFVEYAGAKHSFTNPQADKVAIDGVGYDKAADEKSWAEMKKLFAETISKK